MAEIRPHSIWHRSDAFHARLRVLSDGVGGYELAHPAGADGAYQVRALVRSDTGSVVEMKILGGLIDVGIALLIAAAGKIALVLASGFRDGRRVPVLASVFGCFGLRRLSGDRDPDRLAAHRRAHPVVRPCAGACQDSRHATYLLRKLPVHVAHHDWQVASHLILGANRFHGPPGRHP